MSRLLALALIFLLAGTAAHAEQTPDVSRLEQRAAAGDRSAARALAEGYYAGTGGLPQDFSRAAHYFQILSNLGDVRAMTTLGLMYARGIGVTKSMAEAVRKWQFATVDPKTADPGAEYNLGLAYRNGEGIGVDASKAFYWMHRAAVHGHVLAQTNLGVMYLEGAGVDQDAVEGAAWLIVAAQRGDAGAQDNLKRFRTALTEETLDAAYERAASRGAAPRAGR